MMRRNHARRGAVLLEMLLAMALFVASAAMLSQLHASITGGIHRASLRIEAADLARRALAELELGIVTISDLRTMRWRTEQVQSRQDRTLGMEDLAEPASWHVQVHTERTPYPGLTLIELTVMHIEADGADAAWRASAQGELQTGGEVRVTLRQLIRLQSEDGESETLDDNSVTGGAQPR